MQEPPHFPYTLETDAQRPFANCNVGTTYFVHLLNMIYHQLVYTTSKVGTVTVLSIVSVLGIVKGIVRVLSLRSPDDGLVLVIAMVLSTR